MAKAPKRLLLLVSVLAGLTSLSVPRLVTAHEIANDGQMAVVFHVGANDYPVTESPQALVFYYNDLSRKFNAAQCDCRVVITKTGKTYLDRAVTPISTEAGQTTFTFPEAGTYTVTLSGVPRLPLAFTPFRVNYSVRVNEGISQFGPSRNSSRDTSALVSVLFGVGFLLLIVALYYRYKK